MLPQTRNHCSLSRDCRGRQGGGGWGVVEYMELPGVVCSLWFEWGYCEDGTAKQRSHFRQQRGSWTFYREFIKSKQIKGEKDTWSLCNFLWLSPSFLNILYHGFWPEGTIITRWVSWQLQRNVLIKSPSIVICLIPVEFVVDYIFFLNYLECSKMPYIVMKYISQYCVKYLISYIVQTR